MSSVVLSAHWGGLRCEVSGPHRCEVRRLSQALCGAHGSPVLTPCLQGPQGRLEYSRSVSGMELVIEELVEVMVLREGLMP